MVTGLEVAKWRSVSFSSSRHHLKTVSGNAVKTRLVILTDPDKAAATRHIEIFSQARCHGQR